MDADDSVHGEDVGGQVRQNNNEIDVHAKESRDILDAGDTMEVGDIDIVEDDGYDTDFTGYTGRTMDLDVDVDNDFTDDQSNHVDDEMSVLDRADCEHYMYRNTQAIRQTHDKIDMELRRAQDEDPQWHRGRHGNGEHGDLTDGSHDATNNHTTHENTDLDDLDRHDNPHTPSEPTTRMAEEHGIFLADLERIEVGRAIIVDKYLSFHTYLDEEKLRRDDVFQYSFVRCDEHAARRILERSSPLVPIVTYKRAPDTWTPTIDHFLAYLQHKEFVEVHDYDTKRDSDGNILKLPVHWTPQRVAEAVDGSPPSVINCLNLAGFKENSLPPGFQGLPDYNILEKVRENDMSGKPTERVPNDLSGMVDFTLFATTHATSLAHLDSQGTITTLEVLEGEKLWLIWPYLDRKAKIEWQQDPNNDYSPKSRPYALSLQAGDTLIMPAGTVHAVYTMETCLAAGRRFWDSRRMADVVEAMWLEKMYPDLTNEGEAVESQAKLSIIKQIWEKHERNGYWSFGDDQNLTSFCHYFQKLFPPKPPKPRGTGVRRPMRP